ncbi:MAG: DedA family protein [Chlorobiales bacterium]|nr:DedA family protein [Chlorobiales bacterium]
MQSLDDLVRWGGYLLLFLVIFAETGLFFGLLLPGDSLLITVGLVASQGQLDLTLAALTMTVAAILGDSTGYMVGNHVGMTLFNRPNSVFFAREHLQKAQAFYDRHGGKTIFFARFMPVIRSFATTVAGTARMPYSKFLFYSVTGATAWVLFFTLLGYFVGTWLSEYHGIINLALAVAVALIIFGIFYQALRLRFSRKHA